MKKRIIFNFGMVPRGLSTPTQKNNRPLKFWHVACSRRTCIPHGNLHSDTNKDQIESFLRYPLYTVYGVLVSRALFAKDLN